VPCLCRFSCITCCASVLLLAGGFKGSIMGYAGGSHLYFNGLESHVLFILPLWLRWFVGGCAGLLSGGVVSRN